MTGLTTEQQKETSIKMKPTKVNIEEMVRPNIRLLKPYRCARDDFKSGVLLDANENPHGAPFSSSSSTLYSTEKENVENIMDENGKSVEDGLWRTIESCNRYPDPHQTNLKQALIHTLTQELRNTYEEIENNNIDNGRDEFVLTTANLFVGNGSDECIDLLIRTFCCPRSHISTSQNEEPNQEVKERDIYMKCEEDVIMNCPPTYGMYAISAHTNDVPIVSVPLLIPSFRLDTPAILETIHSMKQKTMNVKLVFLCSPGNPTGQVLSMASIEEILSNFKTGLVVLDEAYIDFATSASSKESSLSLLAKYENLVILRTLSKAHAQAGLRCGIAISSPAVIQYLNSIKPPYNVSSVTQYLATRSLTDPIIKKRAQERVRMILDERERLSDIFSNGERMPYVLGIRGGKDANFLLIQLESNIKAKEVYNHLAIKCGVVVRFRGDEQGCEGCLRVSIGTREHNDFLIRFWKQIFISE